jgi:hypothetical protein
VTILTASQQVVDVAVMSPRSTPKRSKRKTNARKSGKKTRVPLSIPQLQKKIAKVGKETLFGRASGDQSTADDSLVSTVLKRLEASGPPALVSPDGPPLFEDPFLDAAWQLVSERSDFGIAAGGDDLDDKIRHWLTFIVPLVKGRLARNWDVLHSQIPQRDVPLGGDVMRLAVFGDGGYFGLPQTNVLGMIAAGHKPPFNAVIHLGDTYRGGSESEMFRHLIVPLLDLNHKLKIDKIYSLCGNHDLYAGPDGYLGVLTALGQPGRYFAIEGDGWRVACLDTALSAKGPLYFDGQLDDEQLGWLTRKQTDGKRLVILTHHMPRSAWEKSSSALLRQLCTIPGLVSWYWGHEHRSAAYGATAQWPFSGGCVGHGAFLEKYVAPPKKHTEKLDWYPRKGRCNCFASRGPGQWPHGYLELELGPTGVTEKWHTEGEATFERLIP